MQQLCERKDFYAETSWPGELGRALQRRFEDAKSEVKVNTEPGRLTEETLSLEESFPSHRRICLFSYSSNVWRGNGVGREGRGLLETKVWEGLHNPSEWKTGTTHGSDCVPHSVLFTAGYRNEQMCSDLFCSPRA